MTAAPGTLREALRQTADAAPPIVVPDGLFSRARRRSRARRAIVLTVVVLAALSLVASPGLARLPVEPAEPGPQGQAGLPTRLVTAPRWAVDLADAPLASAVAVYAGRESHESVFFGDSFPLTVVGPHDEYRVYQRPEWSQASFYTPTFLLSPDGRYVLMAHPTGGTPDDQGTLLLDLRTGTTRQLAGGVPLAWSPDGTRVVLATTDFSSTATDTTFHVVTVPDGQIVQTAIMTMRSSTDAATAALSPDGTKLAIQVGGVIEVRENGTTLFDTTVDSGWLAGPAAFTPDGNIALLTTTGLLRFIDGALGEAVTGVSYPVLPAQPIDEPPTAHLVGWQDGVPVVVTDSGVVALSRPTRALLTAAPGTGELQIAADALSRPARVPGRPDPGPFALRYHTLLVVGVVAVALLALASVGFRWIRRRSLR